MGIRLTKIYIQNYKSIQKLDFSVCFSNIFFGKNSSGKSAILKAIRLGLSTTMSIDLKDVNRKDNEEPDPTKKVIIDLCFEPEDRDAVEFDSDWAPILRGNIGHLYNLERNIFGIRTVLELDPDTKKFTNKKYWLSKFEKGGNSEIGGVLAENILEFHLTYHYINAAKDSTKNIERREKFWDELAARIDSVRTIDLSTLDQDVLDRVKMLDPSFALPVLERKKMSISGGDSALYVFYLMKAQIEAIKEVVKPYHSLLLIEEPESHLHPQAQMQAMNILRSMNCQEYLTTHSSYIVNHFPIHKLIRVEKTEKGTEVCKFDTRISQNELKSINLKCMLYKAELIFANKVVLFEGQTEHIALPIYFKKYFGVYPFELGYSFVYVEGSNNYKAYLQICRAFHIDWFIFSDGEVPVVNYLNKVMKSLVKSPGYDIRKDRRFVLIKDNMCYEDELAYHGFAKDVCEVIDEFYGQKDYLQYKIDHHHYLEIFKTQSNKYNPELDDFQQCVAQFSKKHKIDFAEKVAKTICKNHRPGGLPRPVLELFQKLK